MQSDGGVKRVIKRREEVSTERRDDKLGEQVLWEELCIHDLFEGREGSLSGGRSTVGEQEIRVVG